MCSCPKEVVDGVNQYLCHATPPLKYPDLEPNLQSFLSTNKM